MRWDGPVNMLELGKEHRRRRSRLRNLRHGPERVCPSGCLRRSHEPIDLPLRLVPRMHAGTSMRGARGRRGADMPLPRAVRIGVAADEAARRLVVQPYEFDVIATTNLFGDIISDVAC